MSWDLKDPPVVVACDGCGLRFEFAGLFDHACLVLNEQGWQMKWPSDAAVGAKCEDYCATCAKSRVDVRMYEPGEKVRADLARLRGNTNG
jgi:hypothetical protein